MTFHLATRLVESEPTEAASCTAASPALLTTEVISEVSDFHALRQEWNTLLRACPCDCIFLTWEWAQTWWSQLAGNRKLHIVTVRLDGRLIALAPLALRPASIRRLTPWPVLEFLASGSIGSDYLSFLVLPDHEDVAIPELTRSLAQANHMLELVRIENTSAPMAEVARQLEDSGWECDRLTTNYCPYTTLAGHTWESYLGTLNARHRKNLGRMLRRLNKDFTVELQRASTGSECRSAMDVFVGLHLRRWSEKGGSSALNKRELIDFHRTFARLSLAQGWLRLYTLLLDGAPAASLYVFKYGNVYYHYQSGFDPDYGVYSPGTAILGLVIREAIEDGAVEFDFLHDNEPYKYQWARHERELVRFELYPARTMGSVYQHSAAMKSWIRRLGGWRLPFQRGDQ